MFKTHAPSTVPQRSPKIFKYSPESLAAVDISFESYKQAKYSNTRKRSFSPIINAQNMRSPDISPIAMNKTFRVSPRMNTPRVKSTGAAYPMCKLPSVMNTRERRKTMFVMTTPLVKRELEHRISVTNILKDMNLSKYIGIFNREEIDFEVFLTLSEKDLHDIGIDCQKDIEQILGKVSQYNAFV
ncbi:ankyrin repeat and SAM domain-containing protein 6-like [Topomyia yanbarensis]|uniref:ankyrin repeat and SAM domain-containing protein 6-like n=1 Tax=Topomyia yanbarensis TaxID=2498891 RepID=UPI00273C5BD9|nr:ankyrin repeat and SAM domain-containing protein 6-like [Topomyia yanbarensis]